MNTSWRSGLFHGLTAALFICSAWGAHAAAPDESVRPSSTPTQTQAPSIEWAIDELARIIKADDLKISPFREDGVTFGTPTWIGCVEVDGALYVRAHRGEPPTLALTHLKVSTQNDTVQWPNVEIIGSPQASTAR
ncbi:DUF2255 family protein [Pseudomonas syringae]|uniref:DUF2255 family protein n=1 Tax=Pseudomonas syringae TaxID=317 RepID=UPI001E40E43A|nr:DUF2255 family protein [Pseudomonas syringae]